MSIALVVTRGYGNGTLTGSIADVSTRGYTIGEEVVDTVVAMEKFVADTYNTKFEVEDGPIKFEV